MTWFGAGKVIKKKKGNAGKNTASASAAACTVKVKNKFGDGMASDHEPSIKNAEAPRGPFPLFLVGVFRFVLVFETVQTRGIPKVAHVSARIQNVVLPSTSEKGQASD